MGTVYRVSLEKVIEEFKLETLYLPGPASEIYLTSADVNRPGLQLAGFFDVFDHERVQVLGKSEVVYLENIDDKTAAERWDCFFALKPPVVVVARNLTIPKYMVEMGKKHGIPLLMTSENTSTFLASLISYLSVELAPRVTRHGVLVEVYGEGLLLFGDSGVGKSETAVELIKRGHRLIADDAVELRKVSSRSLVGSSPENIRHFLELRGIGIINARRLFGMGSIKNTEKVDMIIKLEQWDQSKVYDRMGMDNEVTDILGIKVPSITIPVKPGRNLAVIIEVAAMNNRQKKMGYNAAMELLQRLGMPEGGEENADWDTF